MVRSIIASWIFVASWVMPGLSNDPHSLAGHAEVEPSEIELRGQSPYAPGPQTYGPPVEYYPQNGPYTQYPVGAANGGTTYEQLPDDRGFFYGASPLEETLKLVFKQTWIRLEYLNWTIEDSGTNLLSGDPTAFFDPRDEIDVVAQTGQIGTGDTPIIPGFFTLGNAVIPTMQGLQSREENGFRGTMGLPLSFGAFEASAFVLDETTDKTNEVQPGGLVPPFTTFIAINLESNGAPSDQLLLFDSDYQTRYRVQTFGGDVKLLWDLKENPTGFNHQVLASYRYLNFTEQLTQIGVFDNFGAAVANTSVIDSYSENHVHGPVVGFRTELVESWFRIGVEPRLMLGFNTFEAQVETTNLRNDTDGTVFTKEHATRFAPGFDLNVYGRIRMNSHFWLTVGYDLMWLGRLTRADDNIFYNDLGAASPPDVRVRPQFQDVKIQGYSVGGEFLW